MADTITVLSDIEKVRQRPGMYIGDNDRLGMDTIVREIVDNAKDEYPNFPDPKKPIIVTVESDDSVSVRDYGRGISPYQSKKHPGQIEERLAYTLMGAGGKFREDRERNGNRFAGGLNGTGACATNAMSEWFHVDIWKDGYHFEDHYEEAVPVTKLINGNLPKTPLSEEETGTKVTFKASKRFMRVTTVDVACLKRILRQTSFLNPGLTLILRNNRDEEPEQTFYSERGLLEYLDILTTDEEGIKTTYLVKPFLISGEASAEVMGQINQMEMTIAIAFSKNDDSVAKAFTNGVENPSGGTHLAGFYQGLTQVLRHYFHEFESEFQTTYRTQLDLIKKVNELANIQEIEKLIKARDIAKKTCVVLDFKHDDPILRPQTKDELASPEAKQAVADVVFEKSILFLDKNIQAVMELIGFLIQDLYEKAKEENTTLNISKAEMKRAMSSKLAAAKGKDRTKTEIFIVEGDSAAGSLKENRDAEYQAVLPLRGKVLNAKKTTLAKLLNNAEIRTMVLALGCGIGSKYDESKLNYDKIIITTDQDVDGLHIATLLLTFIFTYMPDLIKNGHVYVLETPLYVNVQKGKKSDYYTYSEDEQREYIAAHRKEVEEVQRNKGLGELSKPQVIETILTAETRRLIRFHLSDENQMEATLESLMGKDVAARRLLFT